jgi:hypothetical protein
MPGDGDRERQRGVVAVVLDRDHCLARDVEDLAERGL